MKKTLLSLLCLLTMSFAASGASTATATLDFVENTEFKTWDTSYTNRTLTFTEASVLFSSANKQSSTITTMPVSKACDVIVTMKEGYRPATAITLNVEQWGSKTQTITVSTSTDGTNFTKMDGTSLSVNASSKTLTVASLPAGTIAIKFSATNRNNQVGWSSVEVTYELPEGDVATPTFSVAEGAVASGTSVELSCDTDGAIIYYTTNGDTPTNASTPYNTPIVISSETTIKAIAYKGAEFSNVASASYTILAVTFSPAPGAYLNGTKITVSCEGATELYVKTDGGEFVKYDGDSYEFTLSAATTIQAYGSNATGNSATADAAYAIKDGKLDTLNFDFFGVATSGNYYSDYIKTSATTGAEYMINCYPNNIKYLQIRSTDNSGIVVKTSAGLVSDMSVTWNSKTTSGRKLQIYGSTTPYTAPSDLYDSEKQGTLLTTLDYSELTQVVTCTGLYPYIGIRSQSGALYLDNVVVNWVTAPVGNGNSYSTGIALPCYYFVWNTDATVSIFCASGTDDYVPAITFDGVDYVKADFKDTESSSADIKHLWKLTTAAKYAEGTVVPYTINGTPGSYTVGTQSNAEDFPTLVEQLFDDAEGVAEYFNLNGMRVNGDNLAKGLYIVRKNGKSVKVLVR